MCKLVYNKYSSDKKDVSILLSFLIWLILGFCIIFVCVNNVFASEYNITDLQIQGYDNTGSSLTNSSTACYNGEYCEMQLTTVAGSYGGAIGIQSPIPILPNHSYAISLKIYVDTNAKIVLSKKNRIALGSSLGSAKYSYETNQFGNSLTYSTVNNNILQFVISSYSENAESYLLIPFTTNNTTTAIFTVTSITIDDLGENNLTQEQIETSLNNQTNDLINNQNQNTQDIIDSNKETQDVIKDQFNTCRDSYNLIDTKDSLTLNGLNITRNQDHTFTLNGTTDTFKSINVVKQVLLPAGTYNLSVLLNNSELQADIYYENNGEQVYLYKQKSDLTFTIEGDSTILSINPYFSAKTYNNEILSVQLVSGTSKKPYEPYGEEICINKLDETNNQLGDLNNSLNNSDSSGATNDASNFFSNFTTDTFGLTSIITAPLSLINNLTSSSCSTLRLPLPYLDNKYLELPCMETIYTNYFGLFFTIYQTITFGIVSYWVIVRIFNQVKDFKNPDHDEIEVLDL